jgi:hypothetical protein
MDQHARYLTVATMDGSRAVWTGGGGTDASNIDEKVHRRIGGDAKLVVLAAVEVVARLIGLNADEPTSFTSARPRLIQSALSFDRVAQNNGQIAQHIR